MRVYGQSKLALSMFTFSLAERMEGTSVMEQPASRLSHTMMVFATFGYTMSMAQDGAEVTEKLAISHELEGISGHYIDGKREPHRQSGLRP